jgi:galactokinase
MLQAVPLYHVKSLHDVTVANIDIGCKKGKLDDLLYKWAHHIIMENTCTKECCTALKLGLYEKVGELMNASHLSLKNDFEVSCEECDILQQLTMAQPGVFGSCMTSGGFGGCTVTLVKQKHIEAVIAVIMTGYKKATGKDCDCFVMKLGQGAQVLAIDLDCKPKSDFYKK